MGGTSTPVQGDPPWATVMYAGLGRSLGPHPSLSITPVYRTEQSGVQLEPVDLSLKLSPQAPLLLGDCGGGVAHKGVTLPVMGDCMGGVRHRRETLPGVGD